MKMSEDYKPGILCVEALLDSCVLAEGKRWYQVKWAQSWVTGDLLPAGVLETYQREEVTHEENDGVYRISGERTSEAGSVEYCLCRGNTWESEEKLNSIDKCIVINYWSHQTDLKEIVKIEEDFGDYGSKCGSLNGVVENNEDESGAVVCRISMECDNGGYEPVPYIKSEAVEDELVDDGSLKTMDDADNTLVIDTQHDDDDDYQCAKCNSLFITGKMKDFVSSGNKTRGYQKCQRCGETYCPRCSISMGELHHNGKTSLFCDVCIGNFACQSTPPENKVKNGNQQKQNTSRVKSSLSNPASVEFCCEVCGKPFNRNSHHEFMFTGENSIQCGDCFKKRNQQSSLNAEGVSQNANKFQYFMPVLYQPISMSEPDNSRVNGFSNLGGEQQGTGIRVLSGNHKDHVVRKGYLQLEKGFHNEKSDTTNELTSKHEKIVQRGRPPSDKPLSQYIEEEASVQQDDEELDGKDQTTGGGEYKCLDCGRVFNRQYTLDTHRRIHTGEKPYVCEICGARFRQSGTKLNHVRAVHTKERPFQCQYCGKTFSHKSSITVHIRIHTKEKPYQCQTCERCFTDRATYLKHQSIHSGVKPYGCPMCTRKFSQKSNLKRHYKNIHELGKPDTSLDCSSGSTTNGIKTQDITDRRELPVMSSAMSEISAMPEYPPEFRPMLELPIASDIIPETIDHNILGGKELPSDSVPESEYTPISDEYCPMSKQLSIVSDFTPEDISNSDTPEVKVKPLNDPPPDTMVLTPTPI